MVGHWRASGELALLGSFEGFGGGGDGGGQGIVRVSLVPVF